MLQTNKFPVAKLIMNSGNFISIFIPLVQKFCKLSHAFVKKSLNVQENISFHLSNVIISSSLTPSVPINSQGISMVFLIVVNKKPF